MVSTKQEAGRGPGSAGEADAPAQRRRAMADAQFPRAAATATAEPMQAAATALLALQSGALEPRTRAELAYFAANEPRQIMRAQQIVLFVRDRRGMRIEAVSSISQIDRASPAIMWFESMVAALDRQHGLGSDCGLEASSFDGGYQGYGRTYPLQHLLWVPWLDKAGQVFAGMLLVRASPFTEAEATLGRHLARIFSQAWHAVYAAPWTPKRRWFASRPAKVAMAVAGCITLALPVPMTALAPVETAPRAAAIVTPGVEGVVKQVLVEPNQPVSKGQALVSLVDTALRNKFEVAEREVAVAEMRYKRAAQQSFTDSRARHELGIAQAELALKIAERNYAQELLERTEIRAERDGIAFFGDKKDLIGKPVAVGERLMEIAAPNEIEFRIDLGVSDAIVIADGARVKVFLDSNPLSPIEARLVRSSYRARVRENQQLSFRLVAEADKQASEALRLGSRGTAQVYSDRVTLGFYLFRRPMSAARQWLGI